MVPGTPVAKRRIVRCSVAANALQPEIRANMADLDNVPEARVSEEVQDAPQARGEFAPPAVQELGMLHTLTQIQFSIPP
jgi:hypothetical protein